MAEGRNVWVGNLPNGVDEQTFKALFEAYGTITSSKCFGEKCMGFVEFATEEEARLVVESLDGGEYCSKTLEVKMHYKKDGGKGAGKGWQNEAGGGGGGLVLGGGGGGGGSSVKSKLCKNFLEGHCKFEERCTFAHGEEEIGQPNGRGGNSHNPFSVAVAAFGANKGGGLVLGKGGGGGGGGGVKSKLCKNFEAGFCQFAERCTFAHGQGELGQPNGKGGGGGWQTGGAGKGVVLAQHRASPYAVVMGGQKGGQDLVQDHGGAICLSQQSILVGKNVLFHNSKGGDAGNLFVKGLPDDANELYLYKLFAPLGRVYDVFIKDSKYSKIGFVNFATAEEAMIAIDFLNGQQTSSGGQLAVSVQLQKSG